VKPRTLVLVTFGLLAQAYAHGAEDWLIASHSEQLEHASPLELQIVAPAGQELPDTLTLRLQDQRNQDYTLPLARTETRGSRGHYRGQLPGNVDGFLRVQLAEQPSNRLALLIQTSHQEDPLTHLMSKPELTQRTGTTRDLDPIPDAEPALSVNEPVYFVMGARDGANARFQLSFKYRLFDPESAPARLIPFLDRLHLGYTQTSLWDLHGESKPFHDTSYRPSFFWQGALDTHSPWLPSHLRGGYEHESNGKDGSSSRSIDTLFIQPAWRWNLSGDTNLIFAPKVYSYLDKDDNPDIQRYRGYADWLVRLGDERGWMLTTLLRQGTKGYSSGQFDLSVPLRAPLFTRTGGFLHFQLFSGYGESLLDYNQRTPPQFRVGFSIVR